MTTTQHTPGPWKLGDSDWSIITGPCTRFTANHHRLAGICTIDHSENELEDAANARLIAAAPAMLDALRTALQAIGDTYEARDNDDQGEMVRDIIAGAIAAATGEDVQP